MDNKVEELRKQTWEATLSAQKVAAEDFNNMMKEREKEQEADRKDREQTLTNRKNAAIYLYGLIKDVCVIPQPRKIGNFIIGKNKVCPLCGGKLTASNHWFPDGSSFYKGLKYITCDLCPYKFVETTKYNYKECKYTKP